MRKILGCLLFLLIMTSQLIAGKVYYVDAKNGNDQNSGLSEATAWKTISKVNNSNFSPGDTILFKRGETWYEMLDVYWSGTDGNPITFGAYGTGNRPIISGATAGNPTRPSREWCVVCYGEHHLRFESLEFQYANGDGARTNGGSGRVYLHHVDFVDCVSHHNGIHGFKASADEETTKAQYVTYTNCLSYDNGFHGFQASDGSENISYINCVAHDNADSGIRFGETVVALVRNCVSYNNVYGVRMEDWEDQILSNITIEGCDIYSNSGVADSCGIYALGPVGWVFDSIIIRYNKIHNNGGPGIDNQQPLSNSKVYYNLIWGNTEGGISWQPYESGGSSVIYNNAVANNSSFGIEVGPGVGVTIKNNILYQNGAQVYADSGTWDYNDYYPNVSFSRKGTHDWSANPLFRDAANHDYYLQSASPCIDSGTDVGLTKDYMGNTVPYGNGVDVGAYEYVGDNPTPPLNSSINASAYSGVAPLTVNFAGNATGGTPPYSYSWDFGDGSSSSQQNPTHTYNDPGDYTVTLIVTDSQNNQDTDSVVISVYASTAPLEASCSGSPTSGNVPLTVYFTGSATGGTPPYSYSWNFGDGSSSSQQNPAHTYSQAGNYTVILTVTDSQNNQDSESVIINARPAATAAYLSCSPASLYFGAINSGNNPAAQYLRIINAGDGLLTWNVQDNANWLSCSPTSGTGRGEVSVSVNASGLPLGLYNATITVSSPEASNSPQYITVDLRVSVSDGGSSVYGRSDIPFSSGNVPVGWKIDNIEIMKAKIKRNFYPEGSVTAINSDRSANIGNATSIEGTQPDIENSYAQDRLSELKNEYEEDTTGRLRIRIKEIKRGYKLRADDQSETDTTGIIKIETEEIEAGRAYASQADNEKDINTTDIPEIQIEEMELVKIIFEGSSGKNIKYIGWGENEWKKLPICSTLDKEKGIFSWIPTRGSKGKYMLYFVVTDGSFMSRPFQIMVQVIPESDGRDRIREN